MIYVLGIGPGTGEFITKYAKETIEAADHIIGHHRHKTDLQSAAKRDIDEYVKLHELKDYLVARKNENSVILASGDPCIYGIAEYLSKFAREENLELEIINGISSIQYMFSKLHFSMNDVYITSSHGKEPNFDLMAELPKVAMVTDDKIGPFEIAAEMKKRDANKEIFVGENLSYKDEKISRYHVEEVPKRKYGMNVAVIKDL